jgi:hypothetical protein
MGRWPEGLLSPNSSRATAVAALFARHTTHAKIPSTLSFQGRDIDAATRGNHDNGLLAQRGDLLDELLLPDGKLKASVPTLGLGGCVEADRQHDRVSA